MPYELNPEEAALSARRLKDLTDAELKQWMWVCLRLSEFHTSWLHRWWWRRRWSKALAAMTVRTGTRLGAGPAMCERCGLKKPTIHIVYEHDAKEHYGHYCSDCSQNESPGWFVRGEAALSRSG